jgi:sugar phosphate isomerase/epimerase
MRFGCCVGPDQIGLAADAGYHYVELPIGAVLPERPEVEFRPLRDRLLAAPLRAEAWRFHLPGDLKIAGPSVDWPRAARYAYTAVRRAAELGGAVLAFCSGRAREVPAAFPPEEALQQLSEFLHVCGAAARSHGLVIGIEPLHFDHSNIINSLPEALALARRVDMPEIGVLPNTSCMIAEGHCPLDVVDAAEWLAHVHISAPLPSSPPQEVALREFAHALHLADYDWRVSVTNGWPVVSPALSDLSAEASAKAEAEGEAEPRDPVTQMSAALGRLRRLFEEGAEAANG